MAHPLMRCGCVAQGVCHGQGGVRFNPAIPVCVTHGCLEVAEVQPELTGRTARCSYKSCKVGLEKYRDTHYGQLREDGRSYAPSNLNLPFFVYKPTEEYDEYFCGCMGWD